MWMEKGEASTVANTKRLWPGLYASGMAANNASGEARMGPIFGGMLVSRRKAAPLIARDVGYEKCTEAAVAKGVRNESPKSLGPHQTFRPSRAHIDAAFGKPWPLKAIATCVADLLSLAT